MAKKAKAKKTVLTLDSPYLLKLVIYLVLGSFWIRLSSSSSTWQIPLPLGFTIGLFLTTKERFRLDRKLEYAILLMAMFIGFWLPLGINYTL